MKTGSALKLALAISILLNLGLGFYATQKSSDEQETSTTPTISSPEAFSGINDYEFGADCNTVFGSEVCTDDFLGLSTSDAYSKAQIYGLDPVVAKKDGQGQTVYFDDQPFRINFNVDDDIVTEAFFK